MVGPENWLGINLGDIMAQSQAMQMARENQGFRREAFEAEREDRALQRQAQQEAAERKAREAELDDYAAAIRWADTPEKWEQAVSVLSSKNPDVAQYRGKFNMREQLALELGAMRQYLATAPKGGEGFTLGPDQVRYGPNGEEIARGPSPLKLHNIPEGTMAVPVGGGAAGGAPDTDAIWQSLIQQESGGKPGVTGPQTPYGRAQGLTQMLPGTAQAMAGKLNLPWQPQMMTDTSPEAAAYQGRLGRAYFDEGLEKYGGDVEKALMYYHGGPDERLWGPKTRAYAKSVMARAGRVPAGTIVNPKPDKPAGGNNAPAGYRWTANGGLEFIPGGPADPKTKGKPEGGGKVLPAGEITKLTGDAEKIATMSELVQTFKDGFSGAGSRVENWAGRLTPQSWGLSTPGQADWWQSMDQFDNVVRNELFGASLTTGEQAAWKASTVTPNMTPERVKANLKRREQILARALGRKRQALQEGGYNVPSLSAPSSGAKFLGFE